MLYHCIVRRRMPKNKIKACKWNQWLFFNELIFLSFSFIFQIKLQSTLYFLTIYSEIFGPVLNRFQYQLSLGTKGLFCLPVTATVATDCLGINSNISSYFILVTPLGGLTASFSSVISFFFSLFKPWFTLITASVCPISPLSLCLFTVIPLPYHQYPNLEAYPGFAWPALLSLYNLIIWNSVLCVLGFFLLYYRCFFLLFSFFSPNFFFESLFHSFFQMLAYTSSLMVRKLVLPRTAVYCGNTYC